MKTELLTWERMLFCMFDVFMFWSFFNAIFSVSKRLKRELLGILFFMMAVLVLFLKAFGLSGLNLAILPILYVVFAKITFKITLSNGIAYTLIYYAVFAVGRETAFELLYRCIVALFPGLIRPWFFPGGMPFLLIEYILAFLFLLYTQKYIRRMEINGNDKTCWYLLLMPVTSLILMICMISMDFTKGHFIQILLCIGAFLLYFSNAVIFVILAGFTNILDEKKISELHFLKEDMEKKKFYETEKIGASYKELLHDMHMYFRQIGKWAASGDTEKIVRVVGELEGKVYDVDGQILFYNSMVLNSVLTEYQRRAQERGIVFLISIDNMANVEFVTDIDKISMFGNLLENAIEAAGKCKEGERKVMIYILRGNSYFFVMRIENTYVKNLIKKGECFISTKEDQDKHGLGIGIVKNLAKKYGGTLSFEEKESLFVTTLMISSYMRESVNN